MKYLLIFIMIFVMLSSAGCFVTPVDPAPDPIPDPLVECVAGYYQIWYGVWSLNPGCEDEVWFSAGTYFQGEEELYYVGVAVPVEDVFDVYGTCPIMEGGE